MLSRAAIGLLNENIMQSAKYIKAIKIERGSAFCSIKAIRWAAREKPKSSSRKKQIWEESVNIGKFKLFWKVSR